MTEIIQSKIIEQRGSYLKIRGITNSDMQLAIGGQIYELPQGKYVLPDIEIAQLGQDPNYFPDVYRVISQGEGYKRDATSLRKITNPEHARKLTHQIESLITVEQQSKHIDELL